MTLRSVGSASCVWLLLASSAAAQTTPSSQSESGDTRRTTTTIHGDTGLWFLSTAEVLPARRWSASVYRVNLDRETGFTDISHFPVTFGVGLGDRVEFFGSLRLDTRIDRDVRSLFGSDASGGLLNDFPLVREGWSGDHVGDAFVGAKVNLLSEYRQQPMALAVRALVKVPTGDKDSGGSSGKPDGTVDLILSKEAAQQVEFVGQAGVALRADPDDIDLSHSVRWGIGIGAPSRKPLRVTVELHGESYFDDAVGLSRQLIAGDGSVAPARTPLENPVDFNVGLTWHAPNGFFAGGGLSWVMGHQDRGESGDAVGMQFRLGYHPGVRVYAPPPPPPPPPTPPPPPPNQPPTVTARCEPCTVEIGRSSTLTADAQDPDGDTLIYRWTAPTGTFASADSRQTLWTAPAQEGAVPFTVTVDDGKGGRASANVTVQVIRPAVKEVVFEDVHFDFDRYTLRPEATRALDEAVAALQQQGDLRLEIEGHTCNIGTNEYNLALGERRAQAVRDYLASRGIGADRLRTVSYGEERPKHDNTREETRRLNRRAALVVRLQR